MRISIPLAGALTLAMASILPAANAAPGVPQEAGLVIRRVDSPPEYNATDDSLVKRAPTDVSGYINDSGCGRTATLFTWRGVSTGCFSFWDSNGNPQNMGSVSVSGGPCNFRVYEPGNRNCNQVPYDYVIQLRNAACYGRRGNTFGSFFAECS
ncbi:hypothetical protein B0H67DRAFT_557027 [Lasiosphaeris hirsuta]|uniref:Uncharacterized protein n=1 Tax=Lasiosphaeris hirsuta TaxID=260670 RepID=A0AA40DPM4_9PEZI|nr:hypothetical protein B0H67DRAFT_557027 [Lasiosphaeris hirsuta]